MLRYALNAAIFMDSGARQRMNYCWRMTTLVEMSLQGDPHRRELKPPLQGNRKGRPIGVKLRRKQHRSPVGAGVDEAWGGVGWGGR
jgi:hypothetical protein